MVYKQVVRRALFGMHGGDAERSGSTFRGQEAGDRSKLPPDVVEGTKRRYLEAYEKLTGKVLEV